MKSLFISIVALLGVSSDTCDPSEIGCYNIYSIAKCEQIIAEHGKYLRNAEADVYDWARVEDDATYVTYEGARFTKEEFDLLFN